MIYHTRFTCPICEIILVGDEDGLRHLHLDTGQGRRKFEVSPQWQYHHSFFEDVIEQLMGYCRGEITSFNVRLNPQGTDFQKKVWAELRRIPFGTVCSYKDLAAAIGNVKASRAVGMANSKNPIPLIVPCHRVIGANGSLTGFAHGLEMKETLLRLEGVFSQKRPEMAEVHGNRTHLTGY